MKTKLFDMLKNSDLAEKISKIKDYINNKEEETEEEMINSDDFKWN